MAFKFVSIISMLIVASSAGVYQSHEIQGIEPSYGQGLQQQAYKEDDYDNGHAEYQFKYAVHDDHTGDIKSQHEERKGDVVHGRYELIDSDGYRRIVEYTADDLHGFQAVVHREPTDIKIPVPQRQGYYHGGDEQILGGYQSQYGLNRGSSGKYTHVSSTIAPLEQYGGSGDTYGAEYSSVGQDSGHVGLGDESASYQH